MKNDLAPTVSNDSGSIINEYGFTAILREADLDGASTGIIGAPRITPTRSGLWIEDGSAAALHAMLIAILEDSARHSDNTALLDLRAGSGSQGHDFVHWTSADDAAWSTDRALAICR